MSEQDEHTIADKYAKLRSIPDYLEEIGRSSYINPTHPYSGQLVAANREYANDLRALLSERDILALRPSGPQAAEGDR